MAENKTPIKGNANTQVQTTKPAVSDAVPVPESKGFKIPPPAPNPPQPAYNAGSVQQAAPETGTNISVNVPNDGIQTDTSPRDMAIGGGVLLVLLIGFFFAKNGYANMLVGKRVAPRSANAAGWWLFTLLSSLATGSVLGIINQDKFFTPLYLGIFIGIALLSLVLMLITGRR